MPSDRALLAEFLKVYPFQPATAWWRAIEIGHLLRYRFPGGWCFDVGCGDGLLTQIIESHAPPAQRRWVGIDPDPAEVALARTRHLYAEVLTGSADQVGQPDARFDFALSNSVLEHTKQIEPILSEVARVLKPGAPFLVTVPSARFRDCLRGPSPVRRALLRQTRQTYLEQIDQRTAHIHYWKEERWRRSLTAAGFGDMEFSSYFSAAEVHRWETISNLTAGVLYELFGRRPPIEIQRSLRLRRALSMPRWLAWTLAGLLNVGARSDQGDPAGGLMVVAYRRATPR